MNAHDRRFYPLRLVVALLISGGLLLLFLATLSGRVEARPIEPPEGYPKLSLSTKTVTPTLAAVGGETLSYTLEIRNTGAYTAFGVSLTDPLPAGVSYNGDAWASAGPAPTFDGSALQWTADVGFDETVVVRFSVEVDATFSGEIKNRAVISHPTLTEPLSLTAETTVTDVPILVIEKEAEPQKPGANKPLTYTLWVRNEGQPALNLPVVVTDRVPADTTLRVVGADGSASPDGSEMTWSRNVTLALGASTFFTFSVDVGDVPSGTIITNDDYRVGSPVGISAGEPHTITVIDPVLRLSKSVWPDPPGSNREMTYTLTLFNAGSLATQLVITDRVPTGVTYLRGGAEAGGIVSWTLPSLDSGAFADLTYTVFVSDVLDLAVLNDAYGAYCTEGVTVTGEPITSVVEGPHFVTQAILDPIAHKPGGGAGTEVTPTLVIRNLGPGNALNAQALLFFRRLQVNYNDIEIIPAVGSLTAGPGCGDKCNAYIWVGDLGYGEGVTFTTKAGVNTVGGEEGTPYTATVVITDTLSNGATEPITGTAIGLVTHYANVVPTKSAPPVVGAGQLLTYTIRVFNRGMSTSEPPVLTDVIPLSTTFVHATDGGVTRTVSETTYVSWTLPLMGPGDGVVRRFAVLVDGDLVSGTQLVNRKYSAFGYGNVLTDAVTSGPPVTTTVREVGLIDSFKTVTPALALPGPDNVLTFYLHIVNSSPISLSGVTVEDWFPWEESTYQRDAVASSGGVISDIVSLEWTGDVAPFSEEVITLTVAVDPFYEGTLTNTATISHPLLRRPVEVDAVAYIVEKPVLHIHKSASPNPVPKEGELLYTLHVRNLGQEATEVVVTDTLPSNVAYVPHSATGNGSYRNGQVRWEIARLGPGEEKSLQFRVTPGSGSTIVNRRYAVFCAEGVRSVGEPVSTRVKGGGGIYLPLVLRQ